jgi:hypothetical protein
MSRLLRAANSGLEKMALACAAFGMLHAAARASETTAIADPWINHAAPQENAAADAWGAAPAARLAHEDPWRTPVQVRAVSGIPTVQNSAVRAVEHAAPTQLVMDDSAWNEKPRGRAPGLIASNDAWRNRPDVAVATPVMERTVSEPRVVPVVQEARDVPVALPSAPVRRTLPIDASTQWRFSLMQYAWTPRLNGAPLSGDLGVSPVGASIASIQLHTLPRLRTR